MSKRDEELIQALQKIGRQPKAVLVGTVVADSVDANNAICNVDVNGLTYYDVSLRAVNDGANDGVLVIPSDGSAVVIARQSEGVNFNIIATTSVEEVRLKGDDYEGLVRVVELTEKLNNLEQTVNDLITAFTSHIHITTATVGATPTPGTIAPTTTTPPQPLTPTQQSDIENENIKHGTS